MNNIIYKGPFKDHIKNHVDLKRSIGYKYINDAGRLKYFDSFTLEKYPKAVTLTKEIVLDWCSKKIHETQANLRTRTSIIRQFGKYLESIGIETYIIPKGYRHAEEQYIPHIYTDNELTDFFTQTDKCKYYHERPYRHHIMPVIFRMIYMCGLRASEARFLKVADVDLKEGVLTINQSKKGNSRLVPMSDFLTEYCRNFSKKVHLHSAPEDYYFPVPNGKSITLENLYKNFRRFLWQAKISHGGSGHGPRIHDFRHSHAVHCLKKWVKQEKDLMTYLPVLSTYMGHSSFKATAYYLRLTADVFPDITLKIETKYPGITPELEGDANEAH